MPTDTKSPTQRFNDYYGDKGISHPEQGTGAPAMTPARLKELHELIDLQLHPKAYPAIIAELLDEVERLRAPLTELVELLDAEVEALGDTVEPRVVTTLNTARAALKGKTLLECENEHAEEARFRATEEEVNNTLWQQAYLSDLREIEGRAE